MKKQLCLALLPVLLTTGCFSSSVSQDKMKDQINEVESNINQGNFTNVKIKDKLQYKYDYKEGEFYRYSDFALILIVPYTELVCTWQENGHYYHYEKYSINEKKNKDEEITKEQFDAYMADHKKTVQTQLNNPIKEAKKLLGTYTYEEYELRYKEVADVSCKYNFFEKEYTLKGTGIWEETIYEDGVETTKQKEQKDTLKFKKGLPTEWSYKNDGDKKWTYSYGKAEFKNPKTQDD